MSMMRFLCWFDAQQDALHKAAASGDAWRIQQLLASGSNTRDRCSSTTPLHLAAALGHSQAITQLLEAGANPGAQNAGTYETPLHLAAQAGHARAVRALLSGGADAAATDLQSRTPLHAAAEGGHLECITLLLSAGADSRAATTFGRTPVHSAASRGHVEAVCLLGPGCAARDHIGLTYLHLLLWWAAGSGAPEAPALLRQVLEAGAPLSQASQHWPTPLDTLLRLDSFPLPEQHSTVPELARMLLAAGCPAHKQLPHWRVSRAGPSPAGSDLKLPTASSWLAALSKSLYTAAWPAPLDAPTLEVSRLLLQAAAAEGSEGCPDLLQSAVGTGSLELVGAVLAAFPKGPALWADATVWRTPLEVAAIRLGAALTWLPDPRRGRWRRQHAAPVLNFCRLAEMLLAAGCQPAHILTEFQDTPPSVARVFPGPPIVCVIRLPAWARQTLSFLPMLAAGVEWAPTASAHADFQLPFRNAARALLLVNHRLSSMQVPAQHSRNRADGGPASRLGVLAAGLCRVVQGAGWGPGRQGPGVHLPQELVLHIIKLAARDFTAWCPQLQLVLRRDGH